MSRRVQKSPAAARRARRVVAAAPAPTAWHSPWVELGLVALVAIVYAQTRHFQFVNWDDMIYVTENPVVSAGLSWHGAVWAVTAGNPYWHPVTWLSHLLDVTLFGLDAGPPHLVNAAVHAANAVILFRVLDRMTGERGKSLAVSVLFALHPLHVESVAWVTERKDVLSSCFLFLALWAYAGYVATPSVRRYVGVAIAFALALMAKPMVVTFPALLLALDYWPLRRRAFEVGSWWTNWSGLIREKVPLFALALVVSAVTVWLQSAGGAMPDLALLSPGARIGRALVSYGIYAREALWPTHLAAFYPRRPLTALTVVGSALALAAAAVGAFRTRRRYPYLLVGLFWYLVALSPVIGLFQAGDQAHADRFMYVALIGILIVVVWGGADLLEALNVPASGRLAAVGAVTVILGALAIAQTATWQTSVTLWTHAVAATPDNYKAYELLGQAKREEGQLDDALALYQNVLTTAPPNADRYEAAIHNDIGVILIRERRSSQAVAELTRAVRLDPSVAAVHTNLANTLATTGQLEPAVDQFRAAIALDPTSVEPYVGLGNVELALGDARDAKQAFSRARQLDPNQADVHNGLGAATLQAGDPAGAIPEFAEALRLRPQFPTAELNLAQALIGVGRLKDARAHLEVALQLSPALPGAKELLAELDRRGPSKTP